MHWILAVEPGDGLNIYQPRAGFIEAVDPSNAIFAADKLLIGIDNVRLTRASIETLPFKDQSFFIIRNDALDRFGTRLERRFYLKQVKEMMENSGLTNIIISPGVSYYHAVGKRYNK